MATGTCADDSPRTSGVNPGAELRTAHERVLRQDTAPAPVARTPKPPAPKELPPRLPVFIGHGEAVTTVIRRFSELRRGRMPILVVRGTPGVGKTAFANHVAHAVAEEFPDGQLFARPHPTTAHANSVLRHFARALSAAVPDGEDMPTLVGAYRTLMSDRKVLLVFDDVRDGDELRQLLPDAPGCVVIRTSRDGLTGFVAATGASVLTIDRLNAFDARRMLLSRVGDPDRLDPEAVEASCRRAAACLSRSPPWRPASRPARTSRSRRFAGSSATKRTASTSSRPASVPTRSTRSERRSRRRTRR
ncbi:AAA family ATPase [Actinospica sp.]|uniref:AAA family ATPase n=1 Tax=Actinospica sp. TaxID=1872142 RepID=UPI002C8D4A40|nr:AAA family ATPase [Actinospica sp.]HWG23391.1 AAA family ATPase [Actinospica sp.]